MSFYIDYSTSGVTAIDVNFEDYKRGDTIRNHMHHYYEFTLVTKGSCIHRFRNVEVPVTVGDVFLIPPNESHSYYMHSNASIVNCYFYPERLSAYTGYVNDAVTKNNITPSVLVDVKRQWDDLLHDGPDKKIERSASISKQGVLHLPPHEVMDVEQLLLRAQEERYHPRPDSEYMKAAILQMILIIFTRARDHISSQRPSPPDPKKQLIIRSLEYIECHFAENISISDIAAASSLSESYFRKIFREATGLSPIDYIRRIRIAKALEYLQNGDKSITEIASAVGISDASYFTRVFKKITGNPPTWFMNNPTAVIQKEEQYDKG